MVKIVIALIFVIIQPASCELKNGDTMDPIGLSEMPWDDMTPGQKAQYGEWQRENAEYILKNLDKKCSELKNIPEYTRLNEMHSLTIPPRTFGPNDICFPSSPDTLIVAYRTLGDNEKKLAVLRSASEEDDSIRKAEYLTALISAGHYREAEKFFSVFIHAEDSSLTEEEATKMIKNREPIPWYLAKGLLAGYWDKIIDIKDKPDDLGKLSRRDDEIKDPSERMYRYFYSKDAAKKAKALEFYKENKIKLMLEKASKTWEGKLKLQADKYLEYLLKSTTAQ
jgi:hypothetical protein